MKSKNVSLHKLRKLFVLSRRKSATGRIRTYEVFTQRVYSPPLSTTQAPSQKWPHLVSNQDYQTQNLGCYHYTIGLFNILNWRVYQDLNPNLLLRRQSCYPLHYRHKMVGKIGFEPTTTPLQTACSNQAELLPDFKRLLKWHPHSESN